MYDPDSDQKILLDSSISPASYRPDGGNLAKIIGLQRDIRRFQGRLTTGVGHRDTEIGMLALLRKENAFPSAIWALLLRLIMFQIPNQMRVEHEAEIGFQGRHLRHEYSTHGGRFLATCQQQGLQIRLA